MLAVAARGSVSCLPLSGRNRQEGTLLFAVLTVCEIVVFAAFLLSLRGALRGSRRGIHGKETALSLLSLEYRRYRGLGVLWSRYSIGATLLNLLWWGVYYWVGGYSAPASLGLTAYETVRVLYVLFAFVAACRCTYCHWRAWRFKPERHVGEREVASATVSEGLLLEGGGLAIGSASSVGGAWEEPACRGVEALAEKEDKASETGWKWKRELGDALRR